MSIKLLKRIAFGIILTMLLISMSTLTFSVCAGAVLAVEQGSIGLGTLPVWYEDAQVQLGWIFDDPTNPQHTDPLPDWSISVGDIPVWDYDPDRIVWDQPGQWYIRIPNLNNDRPVKNFWISWVYDFDTYLPGLRSATSIEWFPDDGYDNFQYIEEWFDSEGNPTEDFLEAAYARATLSVDMYPNPEYEDIWLGTHGEIALAREVYILTLCRPIVYGWNVHLNASKEVYYDVSDFGVRPDATECFDEAYDKIDPPEPPAGVVSYFWHPDCPDYQKLSTSKISPTPPMTWTYCVKPVNIDGDEMCIRWDASEVANIPSEYSVFLDGVNMRETTEYCFFAESDVRYCFTIRVARGCYFDLPLSAGWNMVSFPCLPADATWDDVLGACGFYQVLAWDGTGYITPPNPEFGVGYWVLVLEPCTVTITNGIPCESYECCLGAGWSMIGSIITCTVDADCVFPGFYQLLTWDGASYVPSTTIEPGKGYWALVLEETCIVVDDSCCVP